MKRWLVVVSQDEWYVVDTYQEAAGIGASAGIVEYISAHKHLKPGRNT